MMEQFKFETLSPHIGEQMQLFSMEPSNFLLFTSNSPEYSKLLSFSSQPTVTFYDKTSGQSGCLSWTNGVFRFEGAAEESALIFFTHVIRSVNTGAKIYKDALEKYRGVADKYGFYSADKRFSDEAHSTT